MQTKLTLRMDDQAVAKVKRISKRRSQSVSKIIEEYINEMPEKMQQAVLVGQKLKLNKLIKRASDFYEMGNSFN